MNPTTDLHELFTAATALTDGSTWEIPNPEKPSEKIQIAELSKGRELVSLKKFQDEYRTRPERIKADAKIETLDSLVDYANRFKRPESALHATLFSPYKLTLKVDYHGTGADADPSFNTHRADYAFPLSEPMKAWMKTANGDLMDQQDFAHFLEDRAVDIHNPPTDWQMLKADQLNLMLDLLNLRDDISLMDGQGRYIDQDGKLLDSEGPEPEDDRYIPRKALYKLRRKRFATELHMEKFAVGIEITNNSTAAQSYDPKSGQKTLTYKDDHLDKDGRALKVPELFLINIPVFENGQRHLLPVRLYYRLPKNGAIKWALQIIEPERMIRIAVEAAARAAADRTGLPLFFGTL
ncbi:DUF2303 family protein [Elstera sp.]|jgi:hypothetical protein|uniref:DUF2303 family protein n=1 Tax=Elstera sp. TaxID=1916664 RepID=UPI0037C0E648